MAEFSRIIAAICTFWLAAAHWASAQEITVFAAASLKNAMDEAAAAYDSPVVVSYGGSGMLARQVALGAPADLVVLANTAWLDWLARQQRPEMALRADLLSNRLVLVAPAGTPPLVDGPERIRDQLNGGRLAIGMTASVPAGIYGRQWLEETGLWNDPQPVLAETENVRAALALVARGESPLGLVYASDAQADDTVETVYEIPPEAHEPIRYALAVLDNGRVQEAKDFVQFLKSKQALDIFLRHGFKLPRDDL